MKIYCHGVARIIHKETGKEYEIPADYLDWETVDSSEEPMGQRTHYQASIEHSDLGDISWSIWEYPVNAENMKETQVGKHQVAEDLEFGLEHEPEEDEFLYYSEDDQNSGITEQQLKKLSPAEQVPYLTMWFGQLFWDPAQEMPYDGREGGYSYPYGGPYNANDELREEFEHLVSEDAIQDAIKEIESDGTFDWAPSPSHPDQVAVRDEAQRDYQPPKLLTLDDIRQRLDHGSISRFGHEEERIERQALKAGISELQDLLKPHAPSHGGIGHNRPPENMELDRVSIDDLSITINILKEKTDETEPDLQETIDATGKLQSFLVWGAKKLDLTIDEFMKQLGKRGADLAIVSIGVTGMGGWETIWVKIAEIYQSAISWLDAITMIF